MFVLSNTPDLADSHEWGTTIVTLMQAEGIVLCVCVRIRKKRVGEGAKGLRRRKCTQISGVANMYKRRGETIDRANLWITGKHEVTGE